MLLSSADADDGSDDDGDGDADDGCAKIVKSVAMNSFVFGKCSSGCCAAAASANMRACASVQRIVSYCVPYLWCRQAQATRIRINKKCE